ncbi:MAG: CHAT domain-containing protein [Coleofasciculus sp. B1-GNL1-01]|uniref:CHAT domain-containing protein n=1 Tax=Coleofasciculus sp. B1-GNL1-01 TaxID=3068484 RepID=UPI0032FEC745
MGKFTPFLNRAIAQVCSQRFSAYGTQVPTKNGAIASRFIVSASALMALKCLLRTRTARSLLLALVGLSLSLGIHIVPQVRAELPVATDNLALVQVGKNHYNAGQFAAGIQVLQQAAQGYAETGNPLQQAQVLSLLSLTYQKLGQWQAAEQTIQTSLSLLDTVPQVNPIVRAQVLNAQGRLQLATGNAEAALATWEEAETFYQQADDPVGAIGSKINQAEAMQSLGFYRRTAQLYLRLEQALFALDDSPVKAAGLQNFGNLLRQGGDLEKSQDMLTQSLALTRTLALSEKESQILLSLANTERTLAQRAQVFQEPAAKDYTQAALTYYQQAAMKSTIPITRIQAQLNQLSLVIETESLSPDQGLLSSIAAGLSDLSASRASVYAHVNFAESLLKMSDLMVQKQSSDDIVAILNTAIQQAERLADQRAISYSLGTLGKFYEKTQDWTNAKTVTEKALLIAQQMNAPDIAYQWQWQMGRLLQAQSQDNSQNLPVNPDAITYYTQAVKTLNNLRGDLVALNPEIQFSFREAVEPVYRQFVDLLLGSPTPSKANLSQARNIMEALQLAELDNFFRDACAAPAAVDIDNVDPQAAIVYPIILPNHLDVILKLPGQDNLRHYAHQGISEAQVDQAVEQLRLDLTKRSTSISEIKQDAAQLYDWLIRPFEADLDPANSDNPTVKTLVFVLDGSLRNVPPSTLYDGEKYLIERYAVALTPGLQLLEPKPLSRENFRGLIAGTTNAPSFEQEGFSTLDNVANELAGIQQQITLNQILENQDFVKENIRNQINMASFNLVHIATHGKFSSNPQQTFLLDWSGRINVQDLDSLLRTNEPNHTSAIELLVLSACETATGDKRAALGLAGIAVRAGARSTLATLWQVNDASTAEFMQRFYQQLKEPQLSKAEALRQTQIAFLTEYPDNPDKDYLRPYHWAPFILIGNWL